MLVGLVLGKVMTAIYDISVANMNDEGWQLHPPRRKWSNRCSSAFSKAGPLAQS
jgi:hypothetical protein